MFEKRQHFRVRLHKPIRVHVKPPEGSGAGDVALEALVVDLSLSGALLTCSSAIAPDSIVALELPVEATRALRIQAEVLRCTPLPAESARDGGYSVALHFVQEVPEATVILARNILFTFKSVINSHMN